jgi:hypothetical protein
VIFINFPPPETTNTLKSRTVELHVQTIGIRTPTELRISSFRTFAVGDGLDGDGSFCPSLNGNESTFGTDCPMVVAENRPERLARAMQ